MMMVNLNSGELGSWGNRIANPQANQGVPREQYFIGLDRRQHLEAEMVT